MDFIATITEGNNRKTLRVSEYESFGTVFEACTRIAQGNPFTIEVTEFLELQDFVPPPVDNYDIPF